MFTIAVYVIITTTIAFDSPRLDIPVAHCGALTFRVPGIVTDLTISPTAHLAAASAPAGKGANISVWSVPSGSLITTFVSEYCSHVLLSDDSLAIIWGYGLIEARSLDGTRIWSYSGPGIRSVRCMSNRRLQILFESENDRCKLALVDSRSGKELVVRSLPSSSRDVLMNESGGEMFVINLDGDAHVLHGKDYEAQIDVPLKHVVAAAFSSAQQLVIQNDEGIWLWARSNEKLSRLVAIPEKAQANFAIESGDLVIWSKSSNDDNVLRSFVALFNLTTHSFDWRLPCSVEECPTALAIATGGSFGLIARGARVDKISLNSKMSLSIQWNSHPIRGLDIANDGSIAAASWDSTTLWNADGSHCGRRRMLDGGSSVCWINGDRSLVCTDGDKLVTIDRTLISDLERYAGSDPLGSYTHVHRLADGHSIIALGYSKTNWWEVWSFERRLELKSGAQQSCLRNSFPSTTKTILVTCGEFGDDLQMLSLQRPAAKMRLEDDNRPIDGRFLGKGTAIRCGCIVSADEQLALVRDGILELWLTGGEPTMRIHSIDEGVPTSVATSKSGNRVAVGYRDGRIISIELPTGKIIGRFAAHVGRVSAIKFTKENEVLSGGDDTAICRWKIPGG